MPTDLSLLESRSGPPIQLPERKNLLGGLHIERVLTSPNQHPFEECQWERRDIRIHDWATGGVRFERLGVEVPAHWDENAATIVADKYLFGREAGSPEYEESFRHVFDRIANTYTVWGWEEGYFATLDDARVFNEELKAMLVRQMWAPNSPVWFNVGHWEQWRWGRPDLREILGGRGNRAYHATGQDTPEVHELDNVYSHPQCSACFLTEVSDDMESILGHLMTEGRIFASGSGVGINISTLRSSVEPITGKGRSSGPISFDRGWDRMAGAIKSGGKTRRAARMVILFGDHPDIFRFIAAKNDQEHIAKIVLREHNVRVNLIEIARKKRVEGTPEERMAAELVLRLPVANEAVYDSHMDSMLYGDTLAHQNANHSVSLKGDFWQSYQAKGEYATRWVTNPEHEAERFKAEELLRAMARSVWDNGEPGQHNNDWINLWNPVKRDGDITTSNPCSEYLHLNNTSCNLASFNAYRLLDPETQTFDADLLVHMSRLAMICADLNVERGGFPIPEIARGTRMYRTTGIGYANLGGALMALGVPYDSDEGRWVASQLTSLLTAAALQASAELGGELGPYPAYERTEGDLKEVVRLHAAIHEVSAQLPMSDSETIQERVETIWKERGKQLPKAQGLSGRDAMLAYARSFVRPEAMDGARLASIEKVTAKASEIWSELCEADSFRNSFVTVMAPTGTISAPLGCYDEGTTSIEPDYSLVKYKQLSGGGSLKMFNRLALRGLARLGYDAATVREAAFECAGLDGLIVAAGGVTQAAEHLMRTWREGLDGPVRRAWEAVRAAEHTLQAVESRILALRNRAHDAALTENEYLILNGSNHLEEAPFIKEEDLAVFDCSVCNGNGKRSIAPMGHMRMLGAIQPFISGASSKTVNLPHTATVEDIEECFMQCHDLGVKCIALFRADSKANSVYRVDTPEGRRHDPEYVWNQLVEAARGRMEASLREASKPRRRKLRGRRMAQTVKFQIGGALRGYLTVGVYPDGRCGEIFGRVGQTGTFASGLLEAYCKSISVSLQYGVPLDEIIHDFRYMAFEPSGFAQVGDDSEGARTSEIKTCSSLVDLIMRVLDWLFPAPERRLINLTSPGPDLVVDHGESAIRATLEPGVVDGAGGGPQAVAAIPPADPEKPTVLQRNSANLCPKCGQMTYIQDGKCRQCRNVSCGYKEGGCGE